MILSRIKCLVKMSEWTLFQCCTNTSHEAPGRILLFYSTLSCTKQEFLYTSCWNHERSLRRIPISRLRLTQKCRAMSETMQDDKHEGKQIVHWRVPPWFKELLIGQQTHIKSILISALFHQQSMHRLEKDEPNMSETERKDTLVFILSVGVFR